MDPLLSASTVEDNWRTANRERHRFLSVWDIGSSAHQLLHDALLSVRKSEQSCLQFEKILNLVRVSKPRQWLFQRLTSLCGGNTAQRLPRDSVEHVICPDWPKTIW